MILVTGASGFLGNHLLAELTGLSVPIRALYHTRRPEWEHPMIEWCACDLLDTYAVAEVMAGVDTVFHCAAIVSFEAKDQQRVVEHNRTATAHVVDEAMDAGVRRLVHVSSIAALGRASAQAIQVNEETHWQDSNTNSAYAIGKYQAEMEVWRGMAEGLNAVILNPGIILGETHNWNEGSAALIKTAYDELPWYTEGVNGWVDVKDVARAMVALMHSDIQDERFILTEGNHSYRDIFTMMAQALGKKAPHRKAGKLASGLLWRLMALKKLFTGKRSSITRETARTAQARCYYDHSKWLEAMPEFHFTPIEETIQRMATVFLQAQIPAPAARP